MNLLKLSRLGVVVSLVLYIVTASWLFPFDTYNSPDESANAYFTDLYAQERVLHADMPLQFDWSELLHPRSMLVVDDQLYPGSFLGLPIVYGMTADALGTAIPVTMFLGLFAALAFHHLIQRVTDDEVMANIATIFLVLHPAWLYYSARYMMHNVPFVAWLIIAVWLFSLLMRLHHQHKSHITAAINALSERYRNLWSIVIAVCAGICVGLAVWFRSYEAIWIMPACIVAMLWMCRHGYITGRQIIGTIVGISLMATIIALYQYVVFGGWFDSGYVTTSNADTGTTFAQESSPVLEFAQQMFSYLFPFGIHEMNIFRHVWQYGFVLFPWLPMLAIAGSILAWRHIPWRRYIVWTGCISAWLIIVYGSWAFSDTPDPQAQTIADSYMRYWLPIIVLFAPLAAYVSKLILKHCSSSMQKVVMVLMFVIYGGTSMHLVYGGSDGLLQVGNTLAQYTSVREELADILPSDAVIVVDHADKYLFPMWQVMVPLRNEAVYEAIPLAAKEVPLYYFGITLPPEDLDHLHTERFGGEVEFIAVHTINHETLYQIIP